MAARAGVKAGATVRRARPRRRQAGDADKTGARLRRPEGALSRARCRPSRARLPAAKVQADKGQADAA
ncbi:MAG: hypothetical protein MZW92_41845 [Comamonadaceae bacterium]|nr:hypothetical protein [Comamonadaceae bacterium]